MQKKKKTGKLICNFQGLEQFGHCFIYFGCTQLGNQIEGLVNYCQ